MDDRGYIKLHRAIKDWRYKKKPNYVALWVHLLCEANHQRREVYETVVERGSLLTSVARLCEETGLTTQQVRTILKKLDGEELTIKTTKQNTLISIVNYDQYQGSYDSSNKGANKRLTNEQQTSNNKQECKNKRMKEIYINDTLPIYDTSGNSIMSDDEESELLTLMGRA